MSTGSKRSRRIALPSLNAFHDRGFRFLIMARIVSQLGNQVTMVALAFAVLALTGKASDVGFAVGSEAVALALFLVVGGVAADRIRRRNAMITADLVRFASQGVMAVLLLSGHARLWEIIVLQIVTGIASALYIPAISALQVEVVTSARLQEANAIRGIVNAVATIVGPAIGGILVVTFSPGAALAVDAASFLISATLLSRLPSGTRPSPQRGDVLGGLREGWQAFSSRGWLWRVTSLTSVVWMCALGPLTVLGPVVAKAHLGGAAAWAVILSGLGVGAAVGGLATTKLKIRSPLLVSVAGTMTFVPLLICLAVAASVPVIAAMAVLVGVEQALYWTYWQTILQQRISSEILARVSSYDWLGSYVFSPIGYIAAGGLATVVGTGPVLAGAAVIVFFATAAVLASREIRSVRYIADSEPAHGS